MAYATRRASEFASRLAIIPVIALLRGDTLIMLNTVFGRNPLFMRED